MQDLVRYKCPHCGRKTGLVVKCGTNFTCSKCRNEVTVKNEVRK